MLKTYIVLLAAVLSICACGGNNRQEAAKGGSIQDITDTASIRQSARTMAQDMQERCSDGDIETLAALAQEATDNISYALTGGDRQYAEIYAGEIHRFIIDNATTVGDMASHNYVIKQLVMTVINMPSTTKGTATDTLLHVINSPISTKLPGE